MDPQILHSKEDASVNFIWKGDYPGTVEARYVRRRPDYFVCYLSSQTGCVQACRFCHLTATGQTSLIDLPIADISNQARTVLEYAATQEPAKIVHFSFMARGEPLTNHYILNNSRELLTQLYEISREYALQPRYMISSIMPKTIEEKSLTDIFPFIHPTIYYSIYSMNPAFRQRWLPKSMDPNLALDKLVEYQSITGKLLRLHWSFIRGENDSPKDVADIITAVKARNLRIDINIVRYNPASEKHGTEADPFLIESHAATMRAALPESAIKVIPRVGYDVNASCGMFVR
jgi:adenine C2-methylase RlmN of 23S rRNA A2503 and tRNA A37